MRGGFDRCLVEDERGTRAPMIAFQLSSVSSVYVGEVRVEDAISLRIRISSFRISCFVEWSTHLHAVFYTPARKWRVP